MSMICNLLRVSKTELEDYLKNSDLLESRINDDDLYNDEKIECIDKSWMEISTLFGWQKKQENILHISNALFSNQLINTELDFGYGPAEYVTAEQVKVLNEQISQTSIETLINNSETKKYQIQEMKEIIEDNSYYLDYFKAL